MKRYTLWLVILFALLFTAGPLIPSPALALTTTKTATLSSEISCIASDGTYNYLGTNAGKIYKQTISGGSVAATPIASVPGRITNLTLNGTTLYVTVADGSVYTVAAASSGLTDGVVYIGPNEVQGYVSTWTLTRESSGIYSLVRTADNTVGILQADITAAMRSATSKGMKLTSVQYAFGIGVATPTAHTLAVLKTTFGDNTAPTVDNVLAATAIYKTYGTVTSPYIRTATISSAPWEIPFPSATTNNKYLIEITLDASGTASTTYRFYGMWLVFTHDFQ